MDYSSEEIFERRWRLQLERDTNGAPLLSPLFVLGQGSGVSVIDLRSPDEATGAIGYVPGSVFLTEESVARDLPLNRPVVFVSRTGKRAGRAALQLERSGRSHVAAMAGGVSAWRRLGLKTSRDPAGIRRQPYAVRPAQIDAMSRAHVEQHIGDPRNVRWIKLASMVTYGHWSCIDGRDERAVVGTLGGDAGEFLLSLAALEQSAGVMLDEDDVSRALVAYVDALGDFYMHSDVHAFDRLVTALRDDPRIAAAISGLELQEDLFDYLVHPEPGLWDALCEQLVEPDHIGCGHLRLMLQHGEEYGIRRDLVVYFIRAFFRHRWDGLPELDWTLLPGGHEEAAVLNIRLEEKIWRLSAIPLVSPAYVGRQMFVNHPDVTSYLRETLIRLHLRGLGGVSMPTDRETELRAAFGELGARQLSATLGHLAGGLPIYDVVFAGDGSFTVRDA